jgi:hypothetical protein
MLTYIKPAVLGFAATLAVAAGVGVASGAIPSSDGKIDGCFDKDNGRLRVIDKAKQQTCKTSEHALAWNQKGPKGDRGAPGLGTLKLRIASRPIAAGQTGQIDASCQPGERATGGGFLLLEDDPDIHVVTSGPDLDLTKWVVEIVNGTARTQDVISQVVCAS